MAKGRTWAKSSFPKDLEKYTKYKWEFLRRNPDFLSDWEKMDRKRMKIRRDTPTADVPLRPIREEIEFTKKWKLWEPLCPYKSFDDYIDTAAKNREISSNLDTAEGLFEVLYPAFLRGRPLFIHRGLKVYQDEDSYYRNRRISVKLADTGRITIEIDLNYSKAFLKREFSIFLDRWKLLYRKEIYKRELRKFWKERGIREHPMDEGLMKEFNKIYQKKVKKRNKRYTKKYHFENFDLYLQVYDLRKEGKSWAEITSGLNLNDIQSARNHYKAACKLIEKGIELYVK